jgi:REP element-mobilizing transposase RayT
MEKKMGRPHRKLLAEHTYHTYSQCIDKMPLMKSKKMKDLMIEILNRALSKYKFNLIGYCIMNNHFHFYIKTIKGGEDIAQIMQYIKSMYAKKYNKSMQRTGPFWNDRYKDTIIELSNDPEFTFFWILWYIGYNPVKTNYVDDPRKYQYGSINSYVNEYYDSPVKISLHQFFINLGKTFTERLNKLLQYEKIFKEYNANAVKFALG